MSERNNDRSQGSRPIETLRDTALKLSIFRNESEKGIRYNTVLVRLYTDDKTGEIRESSVLGEKDQLPAANLHTRGHERIGQFKEQDREKARETRSAPAPRGDQGHDRDW